MNACYNTIYEVCIKIKVDCGKEMCMMIVAWLSRHVLKVANNESMGCRPIVTAIEKRDLKSSRFTQSMV